MDVLPRLKITRVPVGYPKEETIELEEARYRLNYSDTVVLAEGRPILNYEELVALANEPEFKSRDSIEVTVIVEIYAGG